MEEWRDIPGYEGIYEASTYGQIRTKAGKTTHTVQHGVRHWKQRTLRPKISRNKKGRYDARVDLWKDGKCRTFLVARLVALAWVDGYKPGLTVNHRDGHTLNNRADNLEWLSLSANIRQGFEDGLYSTCHQIRLKSENAIYHFDSMADASRFLDRCDGYISNCLKRGTPITDTRRVRYEVV